MNETKLKVLDMCKEFTKKHGPEILLGLTVYASYASIGSWEPKEKDKVSYEPIPRKVEEPKQKKMKLTGESRKYADWMCYETESMIYDSYNEMKMMEDFG